MNDKILCEIRKKREFSQLSEKDIEMAYSKFSKRQISEEEKLLLTKELLRKVFSAFVSKKLLSLKDKEPEWILRKHASTRERLPYYVEVYSRIFKNYKNATIIDLGCGINGLSHKFFSKNKTFFYFGIESLGQLVDLTNFYFKNNKIKGKVMHASLFEKESIKKLIRKQKKPRIIFLLKVIDSLEMLQKNYSKELIFDIISLANMGVLSFATRSLGKRKSFFAKRKWIFNFIKNNFTILDDFELGAIHFLWKCSLIRPNVAKLKIYSFS